jgi:hypothetical protein
MRTISRATPPPPLTCIDARNMYIALYVHIHSSLQSSCGFYSHDIYICMFVEINVYIYIYIYIYILTNTAQISIL